MPSQLKKMLAFLPGGMLVNFSSIEIDREDEKGLVLNADGWLVAFDKSAEAVLFSGKRVASFASVRMIELKHFVNGERAEWWVMSLVLLGGRRLFVGRSIDGAKASIAAAHVAAVTGKRVQAAKGVPL